MSDPFADYSTSNYYGTQTSTLSCSTPILSLFGTIFGWIGGLIIFLLEKQNVYVRAVSLHSFIVNLVVFLITAFFLCFYWAHAFFVVMFWIMFTIHIAIIIILTLIAVIKANAGHFLGLPYLDKFVMKQANK